MKYKIHELYKGAEFWTSAKMPESFRNARNCGNCAKSSIASTGPDGIKMVCNEVNEYTGLWETGIPRGYSRQPSYVYPNTTCDEHKFQHELDTENK
jgi:hypothetical protein